MFSRELAPTIYGNEVCDPYDAKSSLGPAARRETRVTVGGAQDSRSAAASEPPSGPICLGQEHGWGSGRWLAGQSGRRMDQRQCVGQVIKYAREIGADCFEMTALTRIANDPNHCGILAAHRLSWYWESEPSHVNVPGEPKSSPARGLTLLTDQSWPALAEDMQEVDYEEY